MAGLQHQGRPTAGQLYSRGPPLNTFMYVGEVRGKECDFIDLKADFSFNFLSTTYLASYIWQEYRLVTRDHNTEQLFLAAGALFNENKEGRNRRYTNL